MSRRPPEPNRTTRLTDDELLEGVQEAVTRANQLLATYRRRHQDDPRLVNTCWYCGTEFEAKRADAKFCSPTHKSLYHYHNRV